MPNTTTLNEALAAAVSYADPHPEKEVGGFILKKKNTADEYVFVPVENKYINKPEEVGLYSPNPKLYGSLVVSLLLDGFENFASFHSHPLGCSTRPSVTDLSKLFKGFPVNYIYSAEFKHLAQYTFTPGNTIEELFDKGKLSENTILVVDEINQSIEAAWDTTTIKQYA